jgi:hypothetical protein
MRLFLLVAGILWMIAVARADEQPTCYTSAENPDWTLTDAVTKDGAGFVWMQGKKRVELTVGSIGTGIVARMATEANGKVHTYLSLPNLLVLDMVPYEAGCPGDRTWVDKDCKRVLISQSNASSSDVAYYFMDDGRPVTNCWVSDPENSAPVHTLECGSGRKMSFDSTDLTRLFLDGTEMRPLNGDLPCSGNFGQ